MDQFGQAFILPATIDLTRAQAYADELADALEAPGADPETVIASVSDRYGLTTGLDDDVDADQVRTALSGLRDLLPAIEANDMAEDDQAWGRLLTVHGTRVLILEANTGADAAFEDAHALGLTTLAGLTPAG